MASIAWTSTERNKVRLLSGIDSPCLSACDLSNQEDDLHLSRGPRPVLPAKHNRERIPHVFLAYANFTLRSLVDQYHPNSNVQTIKRDRESVNVFSFNCPTQISADDVAEKAWKCWRSLQNPKCIDAGQNFNRRHWILQNDLYRPPIRTDLQIIIM